MSEIQWSDTTNKFVITLDKNSFDKAAFLEILQMLRLRFLLRKADFDFGVEKEGEEILSEWWEQNKHRFTPRIDKESH